MERLKTGFTDILRFMVGNAQMHPTDTISWGDVPIGPYPKGKDGAMYIILLLCISAIKLAGQPIVAAIMIGAALALIYGMIMTGVNWSVHKRK